MQIAQVLERVNNVEKFARELKNNNETILNKIEKNQFIDPNMQEQIKTMNTDIQGIKTSLNRPSFSMMGESKDYNSEECEYKSAFTSYLRSGSDSKINSLSRKSLSVGSNPDGGFLVDKATSNSIIKNIEANSIMRKLASIEKISTHALDIIEDLDNLDSGWVTETEQRIDTSTPRINKFTIDTHEIYAQPKATQRLIEDSRIDIGKWLADKIGDRFAHIESDAFINGDGINKPKGILSYESGSAEKSIDELVVTDKTISPEDIMRLYYSLPTQYSSKSCFLMHRNMIQQMRMLKSPTSGHYLWNTGLSQGAPDTLLGVPVYESPHMPVPTKGSIAMAFADFKEAYKIVDRTNITIMRDPYTEKPFVKFYATKRVGGCVVNTRAIKLLRFAPGK